MADTAVLVRYGEIGLKGGNRPSFERRLVDNLRIALAGEAGVKVERLRGRILIRGNGEVSRLAPAAARVFGVTSLSPATPCASDPEALKEVAVQMIGDALARDFPGAEKVRFRARVTRADKTFLPGSMDFARDLGSAVLPTQDRLVVDLKNPELTLEADIRPEGSWIFAGRIPGPGGLPVGSLGRGLCLLSGGIDSPVAAWQCMKRGMRVELVSFYSFPFIGPQTREKIIRLAEHLATWQPTTILHMVPFADIQVAIRDHCPEEYRTVLYRRAMQRIASRLASRRKCKALITGESLGQVASQTLANLSVIEEASSLPVLRPLVTLDKVEIIEQAKRIGTLETSNLPAPDCCTVFQPSSPIIHGKLEDALEAEASLDMQTLTLDAIRGAERLRIPEDA
jgi:thiamine biosynthesis protein ThiI